MVACFIMMCVLGHMQLFFFFIEHACMVNSRASTAATSESSTCSSTTSNSATGSRSDSRRRAWWSWQRKKNAVCWLEFSGPPGTMLSTFIPLSGSQVYQLRCFPRSYPRLVLRSTRYDAFHVHTLVWFPGLPATMLSKFTPLFRTLLGDVLN